MSIGSGRWVRLGALLMGLALGAGEASAQGIRLIPQVGLYVPLTDLGRVGSGSAAVDVARMQSTLGLGLALELLPQRSVSARLNAVYGSGTSVPVEGFACPGCEARSTVALVTGSLVFRPLPTLILLRPYLQAGAGLKRYDFDEEDARREGLDAFVSDQNRLTGQLGAGVELNLGVARVLVELSDFVSGFELGRDRAVEGRRQHDLLLSLGLAIGG